MRNSLSWIPLASGFLVLVLSLGLAVLTITQRNSQGQLANNQSTTSKAAEAAPTISLSSANGYELLFVKGQPVEVRIKIDSAGQVIDGADVIINFDQTKATVVGQTVTTTGLFEYYPINVVNNATGTIKISGATLHAAAVNGDLGTFNFVPLSKGEVNFTVNFLPGATTDSNIALHGQVKDILGDAQNASFHFN